MLGGPGGWQLSLMVDSEEALRLMLTHQPGLIWVIFWLWPFRSNPHVVMTSDHRLARLLFCLHLCNLLSLLLACFLFFLFFLSPFRKMHTFLLMFSLGLQCLPNLGDREYPLSSTLGLFTLLYALFPGSKANY